MLPPPRHPLVFICVRVYAQTFYSLRLLARSVHQTEDRDTMALLSRYLRWFRCLCVKGGAWEELQENTRKNNQWAVQLQQIRSSPGCNRVSAFIACFLLVIPTRKSAV
jgi:hypothetical protein